MGSVFFVSVFHTYDYCDHLGVFSSEAKADAALARWLADNPKQHGYSAEVVRMTIDETYGITGGPRAEQVSRRTSEDDDAERP